MKDGLIFDAAEALEAFAADRVLAVDLETTGFSPYQDRIAVLSVANRSGDVAVVHTPPNTPLSLIHISEPTRPY